MVPHSFFSRVLPSEVLNACPQLLQCGAHWRCLAAQWSKERTLAECAAVSGLPSHSHSEEMSWGGGGGSSFLWLGVHSQGNMKGKVSEEKRKWS